MYGLINFICIIYPIRVGIFWFLIGRFVFDTGLSLVETSALEARKWLKTTVGL